MKAAWQRAPLLGWVIAGVPAIVSALQAGSWLILNEPLSWIPAIEIFAGIYDTEVVAEASQLFYSQPIVISSLFILIAAAWVSHGLFLFSPIHRSPNARMYAAGAVGLSGILYFFLFMGVYSPILSADIPIIQTGGFFSLPIVMTASLAYASLSYDWVPARRANATMRVQEARKIAKQKQSTFKNEINIDIDEIVNPTASASPSLSRSEEIQNEFLNDCQDVIDDCMDAIDSVESKDIEKIESTATTLEQRASALAPTKEASRVKTIIQDGIEETVQKQFGSLSSIAQTVGLSEDVFKSPYGERYRVENLPSTYRQIEIQFGNTTETVTFSLTSSNDLADQLTTLLLRDSRTFDEVKAGIDTVETHIRDHLVPYINKQETKFESIDEETRSDIDRAKDIVSDFEGHVGQTLQRVFIDGTRGEDTDAVTDIEQTLDNARNDLHACDFDAAVKRAETAREMTEELLDSLQFLRGVFIPQVESNSQEIKLRALTGGAHEYNFMTVELFEYLSEPLRNDYAADIEVDDRTGIVSVEYLDPGEVSTSTPQETTEREGGIRDSVLFLLRECERVAGENKDENSDHPNIISIQLASITEGIIQNNTISEFTEFIKQSSAVDLEETELPDGSPPTEGYIELRVTVGERPNMVMRELRDEYREWTSSTNMTTSNE